MSQLRRVVGALAVLLAAGCGATTTPPAGTTTTTAVIVPTVTAPAVTEPPPTVTRPAKTCTVPDVVGMVHQAAQDTMQAAGLYRLREEDATGQGRLLVVDRNWTTTAQSVPAGQVVDCDTEVTLAAKKTGE
ncbi:PASTA domain-containing protein [Actinosynnema sp. CA-299493]